MGLAVFEFLGEDGLLSLRAVEAAVEAVAPAGSRTGLVTPFEGREVFGDVG